MKKQGMGLGIICVCLMWFAGLSNAGSFDSMAWLTEDYPPYNFEENGVKKGIGIDILLEVFKKIGLEKGPEAIKIIPWNRGVKKINTTPNTCLFSTTLTAERQDKLGWKFALAIPQVVEDGSGNHLIARKGLGVKFNSEDDIKKFDKKIGVVRGDVGEGLVLGAGLNPNLADPAPNPDILIKKLKKGRIDVISYGYSTVLGKLKELGFPDEYEVVFTFPPAPMGYAFNKDTDPALVKTFQKALNELTEDGTAEKIKAKYVK